MTDFKSIPIGPTAFPWVHEFALDDLRDAATRDSDWKWVLPDPERLNPGKTRQALTEQAAAEFAKLAQRLRERGHPSETVAHFINRLVFCMFAEDVDLLPNKMFKRMLEHTHAVPRRVRDDGERAFSRDEGRWRNRIRACRMV